MDDIQQLRIYIQSLRQKLEPDPARPKYVVTEFGAGGCRAARPS